MNNSSDVLNIPDFWKQPEKVWRNITKYDFRYYYQSGCTCTKKEAHQAYSQDVQCLLKKVKVNSSNYKVLKSCEAAVKSVQNNHINKFFWDHEIHKFPEIVSREMLVEKELEVLEKVTATTALRSYNQKSKASNNTTPPEEECSSNSICINESRSNHAPKRQQEEDDKEATTTAAKRPNQRETLSEKFRAYKQKIMQDAARGVDFSLETSVPELIALSNVMLLKPSQYTEFARDHFTDLILNEWYKSTLDTFMIDVEEETLRISRSLDTLVCDLQKKRIKTREGVQKLVAMSVGKEDHEAQILIGLSNLIQKLPHKTLLSSADINETELWSSVFDPILSALFSDPDRDTLLRWPNIVPDEGSYSEVVRVQPDAMICEIDQLAWGCTLGYGEAKVAEATPNIAGLANDLLRLAIMTSKTIKSSKMLSSLAFQIHGYNLKVYITKKMLSTSFYTMTEAYEIIFPKSIQELDSFVSRKNLESLVSLYKVFWTSCTTRQNEDELEESESPAFDITTIQSIKDGCMNRSRKCTLKY